MERGVINYPIKIGNEKPQINYDIIQSALSITGLSNEDQKPSSLEATNEFVKLMKNINNSSLPVKNKNKTVQSTVKVPSSESEPIIDHDVKQYTKLYHPTKSQADEKKPLKERLKKLKYLCQKMPFERSTEDVDNIFRILKTISTLSCQVEDELLKLLANVFVYESVDEPGVTIFGNKGFYILLNGEINPLTAPHVRFIGEPVDRFGKPKFKQDHYPNLNPGECFGTMDEIIIDDMDCSKYLLSETIEACEMIFVSSSYYRRILQKYNTQKHADKLTLLKGQEAFTLWPHQALVKIANIFTWTVIPTNTLICKEGEVSPIIAFIQEGSCYVLRKLDVNETLPNGKVVVKTNQVIVGKLVKHNSLGEISLLDKSPMIHSLLTKESMRVMQSDESRLRDLDYDVKLLLRQSCSPQFYNISKAEVEHIYMKQRSKKDWANFKENVILNVIDSRGIRPGQGKWSVIPDPKDIY